MSGRNPPLYCTLTLIAMQGHQQKGRQNSTSSKNKDKSNTIIETSTAEDHDDENLHNPETCCRTYNVVVRPTLGGTKHLHENGPNTIFVFGTKNLVRVKLMATVLFRHGFDRSGCVLIFL